MWSYYRPPTFYTQSARRLVCSPQGNNCHNKQNIVVFIPYFPHVKSDLNRCFAGGKKITTTRKHLTISFGVRRNRYKTDRIAFLYFKKYSFWFKLTAFKRERSSFVYLSFFLSLDTESIKFRSSSRVWWVTFCGSSKAKPEIHRPDVFV